MFSFTVRAALADLPLSETAVIVTLPIPTADMFPKLSTLATEASLLLQVIFPASATVEFSPSIRHGIPRKQEMRSPLWRLAGFVFSS